MAQGLNLKNLAEFRKFSQQIYKSVKAFKTSSSKNRTKTLQTLEKKLENKTLDHIEACIRELALGPNLHDFSTKGASIADSTHDQRCSVVLSESMERLLVSLDMLLRSRLREERITTKLAKLRTKFFDSLSHNIGLLYHQHQHWFSERVDTWIEKGAHVNGFTGAFHKNISNRLIYFREDSEARAAEIRRRSHTRGV